MEQDTEKHENGPDLTTLSAKWRKRIAEADRVEKTWRERARKIVQIYRGETDAKASEEVADVRYNILNANVQTMLPAVYQKTPTPDIRRRFVDSEELAKQCASLLQKTLSAVMDGVDFDTEMRAAILDEMLPGRGVVRVRYLPFLETDPETQIEEKVWESIEPEHVFWENLLIEPVRRWKDVNWIAFKHLFTKTELENTFGSSLRDEAFNKTEAQAATDQPNSDKVDNLTQKALVWEIWDRETHRVIWLAPDGEELGVLRIDEDPLELEDFFPIPKPLFAVTTTDTLVPVPYYALYQDLAAEMDTVTKRIGKMIDRIRVRGAYNSAGQELANILTAEDGDMIAVEGIGYEGGLDKHIYKVAITEEIQALKQLYEARERTKQTIYEVTGIADIMRGASTASETATAQRIKANFGSVRIEVRRASVARMVRDVFRMMAEIVATHFAPETIHAMTGEDVPPELADFMRSDAMRAFAIDVESDATVAPDEVAEQEATAKLMEAFFGGVERIMPMVKSPANPGGTLPPDVAMQLMRVILKPFKGARQMEDVLIQFAQSMEQAPDTPDPVKETMQELDIADREADVGLKQAKAAHEGAKAAAAAQSETIPIL